jgi:hypothetical protein
VNATAAPEAAVVFQGERLDAFPSGSSLVRQSQKTGVLPVPVGPPPGGTGREAEDPAGVIYYWPATLATKFATVSAFEAWRMPAGIAPLPKPFSIALSTRP